MRHHDMPPNDPNEQAAIWWLRYRGGGLAMAPEFTAWLQADAANVRAWDEMLRTAQALDELPVAHAHTLRAMARAALRPEARPPSPGRRVFAVQAGVAAALLAMVGGGTWLAVDRHLQQATYSQAYVTGRGQALKVKLADGSLIELDTATRLQVRLYRDRREISLQQGQLMLTVAPDAARVFSVAAGHTRVSVLGTRFQVRHVGEAVAVEVEEGRVRVEQAGRPGVVLLGAGQAVDADAGGALSATRSIPSHSVAAWRGGRLNFDNTPLTTALAEFGRYGETRLHIADPRVGALRVTGSFEIGKLSDFVQALPQVLPVRLIAHAGQTELVLAP